MDTRRRKSFFMVIITVICLTLILGSISFLSSWAGAASTKPVELKFSYWMPTTHSMHTEIFVPWAKEVEKRTGGRVKIALYPGGALGAAKDHVDMVAGGICDIAYFIHSYTSGRFPLTSVVELPLLFPNSEIGTRVLSAIYDKYLKGEYADVKVLYMWCMAPANLHTNKKAIHSLEDLKGLKLRTPGAPQAAVIERLGATSLSMPINEIYSVLERGVADGAVLPWEGIGPWKLQEVLKYHTVATLYSMANGVIMNLKSWNNLSPDVQKILDEINKEYVTIAGKIFDEHEKVGRKLCEGPGHQIYSLTPTERQKWSERISPLWERWVADMEAKGLPGRKIAEETRDLSKKYSK
ncbi:MAG: hypothetical protein A2169_15405 [Deltaproteobacteria bacterium RBG_13_47_9]|nr:MAG: hypothetical protein A2169_15405 [Deltaproteobacteria bacterium RBG_13_47_9]